MFLDLKCWSCLHIIILIRPSYLDHNLILTPIVNVPSLQVPREECREDTEKLCRSVKREECESEPVCKKLPKKECSIVAKEKCIKFPTKECAEVPKQVRQSQIN